MSFMETYAPPRRRFLPSELEQLSRAELVALVQQEPARWPKDLKGTFLKWKTNIPDMIWALVNCEYTTDWPTPSFPSSSPNSPDPSLASGNTSPPANNMVDFGTSLPDASLRIANANRNTDTNSDPTARAALTGNETVAALDSLAVTEPVSSESRSVVLLITDIRNIFSVEKYSQRITVPVVSDNSRQPQEWRANAKDIISALQLSSSAFEGSARIGTPYEDDPHYLTFLGIARDGVFQPNDSESDICIPVREKLELTLAKLKRARESDDTDLTPPLREPWVELQDHIKHQSRVAVLSSATTRVRRTVHPLTPAEENWLTARAQEMEGYTIFLQNRNRRLDNLERVKYWNFAARFSEKYYASNWPANIARSGGTSIRKQDIEMVLRMKATALNQAINMTRILNTYYDSPVKFEAVVQAVEDPGDSQITGSEGLAKFLIKWEKDHLRGLA
ncbi:hypothetical protein R3P38DRAFT_3618878 [Favolaschia claudopus]|uniref:Uncharacterized protein n=1 Tax=Favolaschia claudopus TaxID=2862362 RepID=A0AAW0DC44_9AGAR